MVVKQEKIILYKNRGETPLDCILRFKKENPEYENDKMTYAGRLDPLAEGLLLVLVGEECKNKEKYLGFDKEYEVDILFGFATDTYDLLGIVKDNTDNNQLFLLSRESTNDLISEAIESFVGKFSQKYPPFSSKNIKNILITRNTTNDVDFCLCEQSEAIQANKNVEIKSIEFLGERMISKIDLEQYIIESVNLVKGDFRQEEILKKWKNVLNRVIPVKTGIQNLDPRIREDDTNTSQFMVVSIRVDCTSGTYMRSLANSIGEKVGIPALALNIKRTKVGIYEI
jgi:tRNA pseudouridine(55) synthase